MDRLIRNTRAGVEAKPDDPRAVYTLGRLHYMAVAFRSGYIHEFRGSSLLAPLTEENAMTPKWWVGRVVDQARFEEARRRLKSKYPQSKYHKGYPTQQPVLAEYQQDLQAMMEALEAEGWKPEGVELAQQEVDDHMDRAVANLSRAVEMHPEEGLYRLTLASVREYLADRAEERGIDPDGTPAERVEPGEVRRLWLRAALDGYADAFNLTRRADRKLREVPPGGVATLVSYEAAEHYRALVKELGLTEEKQKGLATATRHMEVLKDLPPFTGITPIVLALDRPHALSDLIDADRTVTFDLDGDGRAERRVGWPRGEAGLLCWVGDPPSADPATADITSGRQLIGSVTWWVFWRDGYAVLDALDDDRDGWLTGDERRGLGVWFDRNGDARSDRGEVVGIESLPIRGLSTRSTATAGDGRSPMNPRGLRLEDGRTLPTWDWVTK